MELPTQVIRKKVTFQDTITYFTFNWKTYSQRRNPINTQMSSLCLTTRS